LSGDAESRDPETEQEAQLSAVRRAIAQGRDKAETTGQRGLAWLDRARKRSTAIDVAALLYERDVEAAGGLAGSAVAFRLFLLFVPVVLVAVGLAGFAADYVSATDASSNAGVTGAVADQIRNAFAQSSGARWTVLIVGLFGMATAGRSLAKALVMSSALSWRVPPKAKATVRTTAVVVAVIFGLAVASALVNRLRASAGIALTGMSIVGVACIFAAAWVVLSLGLPRSTRDPGAVLPGAALAGASLAGLQAVTQLYVPGRITHASQLYGSIGVAVVTLGWFFIVGRMAVFTMTLNAVMYERIGSITEFVFSLPVLRILPKRSPKFARFFGLADDEPAPDPEPDQSV